MGSLAAIVVELKQKTAKETVMKDIRSLKLEVTALKPKHSSVLHRTTQIENNYLNLNYRTEKGIFNFELAGQSKAPYNFSGVAFDSMNSSRRNKPDDESDDDALITENFEVSKKTTQQRRQNFGTK